MPSGGPHMLPSLPIKGTRKKYWKNILNAPSFEGPKKVAHLWGFALHYLRCPQPNKHHAGSLTSTKWFERLRGPKTRKACGKNAHVWKTVGKTPHNFWHNRLFSDCIFNFSGEKLLVLGHKFMWMWMRPQRILQWSQIQWNLSIAWWACLMLVVHGVLRSKFHRILRSLILIYVNRVSSRTVVGVFLVPSREDIWCKKAKKSKKGSLIVPIQSYQSPMPLILKYLFVCEFPSMSLRLFSHGKGEICEPHNFESAKNSSRRKYIMSWRFQPPLLYKTVDMMIFQNLKIYKPGFFWRNHGGNIWCHTPIIQP